LFSPGRGGWLAGNVGLFSFTKRVRSLFDPVDYAGNWFVNGNNPAT
jgi:hypothetical protein